ncbi:MAG: ABC transporter substrate-binding protein [Dehalococcoidia bacterium]
MVKRRFVVVCSLALLALAAACGGGEQGQGPTKVTFMAGFKPQANLPFVGAYVAQEKGFFAQQDLDVDIKHVAQPGDNFRFLAAGEVQFSTADAAVVLERRAGDPSLPIVAIALIGQRGQQGFGVLADSGIGSPKDWEGKTVGYKGSKPTPDYLAILEAVGADRSKVKEVRVGFDPRFLTEGTVDVFPLFISNEPDTLRRLGFDTQLFEAADYGVPTLGLTYVTTEEYIRDRPDVVRRFLKAVLRGILWARENPDEAIDIVLTFAPNEDRDHQRFMMETELAAALTEQTEANGIGWMTAAQWRSLYDMLLPFDALSRPLDDPTAAFADRFLNEIYQGGELVWP